MMASKVFIDRYEWLCRLQVGCEMNGEKNSGNELAFAQRDDLVAVHHGLITF